MNRMNRILITTALGLTLALPVAAQEVPMTQPTGTQETLTPGATEGTSTNRMEVPGTTMEGAATTGWETVTADDLRGKTVWGPNDAAVGDVSEVVLDEQLRVSEVIVDVGGFLGIGAKPVALDPSMITLRPDGDEMTLHIAATEAELKAMPEYQG